MCECQGNPLARVTLALGLPYLLVNRALVTESIPFRFGLYTINCMDVSFKLTKGGIGESSPRPVVKTIEKPA